MIQIEVYTSSEGLITAYSAVGHAVVAGRGDSAVCAAVSSISRTAAAVLRNLPCTRVEGSAPKPGNVYFTVEYESGYSSERAFGICETVLTGLQGISDDNPEIVKLTVQSGIR